MKELATRYFVIVLYSAATIPYLVELRYSRLTIRIPAGNILLRETLIYSPELPLDRIPLR